MRPSTKYDLGDNYELWTGLYQSTVLGSRPFLNVDIAHKAFPKEMPVLSILEYNRVNLNSDLQHRDRFALQSHLNGLMIKYAMPGHEASARNYKFFGFNQNSKMHKFRSDQDQKEYTIEQYFRSRNVTIKYPNLPCLKLGNAVKNITVPMEFCCIAGSQVISGKIVNCPQARLLCRIVCCPGGEQEMHGDANQKYDKSRRYFHRHP